MTEQGLNAAQIRTVVQEVSSEAVPELVRARRELNGGCSQILLEEEPGGSWREAFSKLTDEQRARLYPGFLPILLDRSEGRLTDRDNSLFSAFSNHSDRLGIGVNIGNVQETSSLSRRPLL